MRKQEILPPEPKIVEYREYHAQLAELKKTNDTAVFDYRDPKGNKEARSHIYKLRQTKSAVDKKRKEIKAEVLERGRFIDSEAKAIIGCIESMIDLHESPIKEIEAEEAERVQKHKDAIESIKAFQYYGDDNSSEQIKKICKEFELYVVDESFEEFMAEASATYKQSQTHLISLFDKVQKREAEQAELERLRKEQEAREQAEREAKIAAEAKAQAEAEAKRQAEEHKLQLEAQQAAAKAEAELKEREAAEAIARAEREKLEAISKAEQEKRDAEAKAELARKQEIERQEAEKNRIIAEERAREANRQHVGKIRKSAKEAIMTLGVDEETAKAIVIAINDGKVPNVKINY